jgi:hypothetical protein
MAQQILTPGFLYWDGFKYILTSGTFTPAGDLSGDAISQTVVGIQGNPIPGPTGTNTVLTWTGSALIWGSGGSGISTIQNQGTSIAGGPFSTVNFTGAGVVASNAGGGVATITIAGGLEPPFPLSDIEAGTTGYVAISIDGVSTWTPLTQVIFQTSTLDLNIATPILAETTIQGGPFGSPTTTTLWADPPLGTQVNFKYVTGGSPPIWTISSDGNDIDGSPSTTLTSNGQTLVLIYVGGTQGWLSYRNTGSSFTASGDLSGSSSSQTVIGIQAVAISSTAPSTGQVLTATSATAADWQTPSEGNFLAVPGTITKPPTVAGGGWSFINNPVSLSSATDITSGISLFIDSNMTNISGYVRAGSGSPTMSVEVGLSFMCDTVGGPVGELESQQFQAGVAMYESSTGKYLVMLINQYYNTGNYYPYIAISYGTSLGSVTSSTSTYNCYAGYSNPFLRLRLSGTNVIGEISIDREVWATLFTVAITAAFTTAPNDVGIGFMGSTHGNTYISVFDFVTT